MSRDGRRVLPHQVPGLARLDEAGYSGPYVYETALPTADDVIRRARETSEKLESLRGR